MRALERTILRFHERLSNDPYHRYRSWGHCYRYFRQRPQLRADRDLDRGALHLGFYLASWGMYRGSTFLLWKDFRIHRAVVREVLQPKYDSLLAFQPTSVRRTAEAIRQILRLADAVRDAYRRQIRGVDGRRRIIEVTDALATKIMLATLACVPAYDTYVVAGLRAERIPYSSLNERNLNGLFDWYEQHRVAFESARGQLRENGLRYPPMKLVDMYLWEVGRRISG